MVSSSVFLFRGEGGQSALELGGGVVVGFFVSGGRGLVSFRGCEGGTGASQLWSCVLRGWRRVSFRGCEGLSQLWSWVVVSSSVLKGG